MSKVFKKIAVWVMLLAITASLCSCSGKEVTLDELLECKSEEDVIELLGKPDAYQDDGGTESPVYYDVTFLNRNFQLFVGDFSLHLVYYFEGMKEGSFEVQDGDLVDTTSYSPTAEEKKSVSLFVEELIHTFNQELGMLSGDSNLMSEDGPGHIWNWFDREFHGRNHIIGFKVHYGSSEDDIIRLSIHIHE